MSQNKVILQPANFDDDRVIALFQHHHATCNGPEANIPGSKTYALDVKGLKAPDLKVWTIWSASPTELLGCGALKILSNGHEGELKAMHTVAHARGRGIGAKLLDKLLAEAETLGLKKVYIETGVLPQFEPARRFYARAGFMQCGAFGDYVEQENSYFMCRVV